MYKILSFLLVSSLTITCGLAQSQDFDLDNIKIENLVIDFDIPNNQREYITIREKIKYNDYYIIVRDIAEKKEYTIEKWDPNFKLISSVDLTAVVISDESTIQTIKPLRDRLIITSTKVDKKTKKQITYIQSVFYKDFSITEKQQIAIHNFKKRLVDVNIYASSIDHFIVVIEPPFSKKEAWIHSYLVYNKELEQIFDYTNVIHGLDLDFNSKRMYLSVYGVLLTKKDEVIALAGISDYNTPGPAKISVATYRLFGSTIESYSFQKDFYIDSSQNLKLKLENETLYGGGYFTSRDGKIHESFFSFNTNTMTPNLEVGSIISAKTEPDISDIIKLPNSHFLIINRKKTMVTNDGMAAQFFLGDFNISMIDDVGQVIWTKTIDSWEGMEYLQFKNNTAVTMLKDKSVLFFYNGYLDEHRKQDALLVSEVLFTGEIETTSVHSYEKHLVHDIYQISQNELIGTVCLGKDRHELLRLFYDE